jgi:hypothetical protein
MEVTGIQVPGVDTPALIVAAAACSGGELGRSGLLNRLANITRGRCYET